jgi:GNAT superfamily N-acetyltransferase
MTIAPTVGEEFVARDGTVVSLRPIRPDDEARLMAFHERLSPRSQQLRFFSVHPHLQPAEVRRFVNVDGARRVALVATQDDDIVGVARFDRVAETTDAEAAFVVRDDLRGRGLGTALLEHLAQRARENGVTRLVAQVLPGNARMLHVFRHFRPDLTAAFVGGVIEVKIPLDPNGGDHHD